ncbi:hypothetical protein [Chromobacterium alticapitis]|uniref:hypothetical protein n=1 Tax=Chromobacterium alticapitis TaxID=2073169 RepID=UPI001304B626|nr:hypothetical protein [Chromobacterium alticapitis]
MTKVAKEVKFNQFGEFDSVFSVEDVLTDDLLEAVAGGFMDYECKTTNKCQIQQEPQ